MVARLVFLTLLFTVSTGVWASSSSLEETCQYLLQKESVEDYLFRAKLLSTQGSTALTETFEREGRRWVLKTYRGGGNNFIFQKDKVSLQWLKDQALPSDPIQVVDFQNFGNGYQVHDYIEGQTVSAFLWDRNISLEDKQAVIAKFERHGHLLKERLIRAFPDDVVQMTDMAFFAVDEKSGTPLRVDWFKFVVREPSIVLVPHTDNVIVEKDTHKLWLIDPR